MLCNVAEATDGQVERINKEYVTKTKFFYEKCTYDQEDDIYFITVKPSFFDTTISFQVRQKGSHPCFFSLQKGKSRYDISYVDIRHMELYHKLKIISDRLIKDWNTGNLL